jgi:signal transduction histidine kinase
MAQVGKPATGSVVRYALTRFLIASMLALLALGTITILVSRHIAEVTALNEAMARTSAFADNVVSDRVTANLRAGDPAEVAAFDDLMQGRMKDGSVAHVKVWDPGGRIVWADEKGLIGQTFPLGDDEAALFGTHGVVSDVSSMSKIENATEATEGPHLEVYAGTQDAAGQDIVFEMYWSTDRLVEEQNQILTRIAPLALLALVIFQVVVLRLALTLARNVDRGQTERSNLLRDALAASELERSRLAQDLHDGVIQDLSGISYALPAVTSQLPESMSTARRVLDQMTDIIKRDVSSLRNLLTDVYPADLAEGGLGAEVERLADSARASGIQVDVQLAPEVSTVSLDECRLVYRVIREGLRNVVSHAEADHATVRSWIDSDAVVHVVVEDDGRGVSESKAESGHVGLKLLGQTLRDVGGALELKNLDGTGAALAATFPRGFLSAGLT